MGSAHGQGQGAWNGLSWEANPSFPRRREEAYGDGGLAGPPQVRPLSPGLTPLPAPFPTRPVLRPLGATSEQGRAFMQQHPPWEGRVEPHTPLLAFTVAGAPFLPLLMKNDAPPLHQPRGTGR